jgi:beta-barrel assembly-enhancing protease
MTKNFPKLLCALCALLLAACSPQVNMPQIDSGLVDEEAKAQQLLVLRDQVDKLDRLSRVAWAIRSQNAELCGDKIVYGVGLSFLELDDYDKDKRDLVREAIGIEWRPTVFQVPPDSPGHAAGIRRGDIVLLVAETHVGNKKEAYAALKASIEKGADIPLVVERAGERLPFVIKAVPLCGYPVALDKSNVLNAYADGNRIMVLMGMMKFVRSDDELAGVIGHELAHNTQLHIRDKRVNATLGSLLVDLPVAVLTGVNPNIGGQLGGLMYSQEYEHEADYVGLYYTSRAGYDIRIMPEFWRRMAVENPKGITMGTTHPSTSKRFVALDAAASEIENKRKTGLPLVPGTQKVQAPTVAPASAGPEAQKPAPAAPGRVQADVDG